jgi:phage-related protein
MKPIVFHGRSLTAVRKFPSQARREIGHQLDRLQHGLEPLDWRPMKAVGSGVREIRVQSSEQYRVMYCVPGKSAIHVLHAFRKTSRKTAKRDINQTRKVFKELKSWTQK